MAHVFCYWSRPFFYAFGNTPPICITDNLLPEEDANILLLGCGDVRNILFTMFSDEAHGGNGKAKLDVTCCDVDPGVLARKILLLSLLADDQDGKHIDSIWNFYYDIYITHETLKLVTEQAKKLAGLTTMEGWNCSSYGSWMRMCSGSTLTTLNGLWSRYANVATFSGAQRNKYLTKYSKGVKEIRMGVGKDRMNIGEAIRAAGFLGMGNLDFMSALDECEKQFWDMCPTKKASNPNPTFAYTGRGEEFTLHYGSNYVLGYHLLPALVTCNPLQKEQKITASSLQNLARKQFSEWCRSFRMRLKASFPSGNLTLRFFSGNLTSLCTALRFSESGSTRPGIYTHGWTATEMVLSNTDYGRDASSSITRAPTQFNFIDTSNLIDHVGLLNLLITAAPLLLPGPTSVLRTESFKFEGASDMESLSNRICGDPLLLGMIFGVFPSPYFAGFTSRSSTEDSIMRNMGDNRNEGVAFERTQWKHLQPVFSDGKEFAPSKLTMDPKELARLLYNVYLKMFEKESFSPAAKLFYTRETFSKLLLIIKSRIDSNWEAAMETLVMGYIATDRKVFMTMNNIQDLNTHLQLDGLFEFPVPEMCKSIPGFEMGPKQMQGWKTVPNIVTVSLVVPRENVAILLNGDSTMMGSPILQAVVQCTAGHNQYHSLQLVFGKVFSETIIDSGETRLKIEQDENGFFGSQDLVVIFQVPSWTLRAYHETCTVAFGLHSTPGATRYFAKKLGLMLHFYQARLAETNKVFVTKLPPNVSTNRAGSSIVFPKQTGHDFPDCFGLQAEIRLNRAADKLETLALKVTGFPKGNAKELADGAVVRNDIRSSNSVQLRFGTFNYRLAFPFPVAGSSLKTRIARKSQYIELIASVADVDHEKFPVGQQKRFPMIQHGQSLAIWNIHRVSLDALPGMNLLVDHKWINAYLGASMSKRERRICSEEDTTGDLSDTMVGVKDTISHLFLHFMNSRKMQGCRTFVILPTSNNPMDSSGGDFLIYVTDMKLDLANSTLVLDACILPFNQEFKENKEIAQYFIRTQAHRQIMRIFVGPKEQRLWKELICSFIERARGSSYSHHPTKCEYSKNGKDGHASIPLSYDDGKIPFCSCGRGKASQEFLATKEWKPLAKFVTRAAISPLFHSELREVGVFEGLENSLSTAMKDTETESDSGTKRRSRPAEATRMEMEQDRSDRMEIMAELEERMRQNLGL